MQGTRWDLKRYGPKRRFSSTLNASFVHLRKAIAGLVMDDESKCPVSGKRKYASEGDALATAAHQIATANAPKELRAYLCSWCDAWHLTKNTGRAGKHRR